MIRAVLRSTRDAHQYFGRQRGLVVVELAITLPLIVLIMFATAELGRALYQYSTLTKAVESGARYYASAVNDPFVVGDPISITKNLIIFASPDGGGARVLPGFGDENGVVTDPTFDAVTEHITVSATYKFEPIIGKLPIIGKKVLGDGFTMTVSQTMRAL